MPETVGDHFRLDMLRTGGATTPASWKLLDLTANLDAGSQVVEETNVAKLIRDGNGALLRWRKDRSGTPEHVDFLIKDRKGWETHIRPCLIDSRTYERRIDFQRYRDTRAKCEREGVFLCAGAVAVFDLMSPMCGHENLLMGMAADPNWVRDMGEVYANTTINLLEMLFDREGLPDGMWFWDDLGFKHRPFMSPAMYHEIIFSAHRRLFEFAHSHGLPVILHADGMVESLIPQLIEAGIDCLQPLEVKAGMDLLRIKKNFGQRIALIGGMDARELISNDRTRVRKELESKLPQAMAGKLLHAFAQKGVGPGQIMQPHGLAFDPAGRIFVADDDNMRVNVYTKDGSFIEAWHRNGVRPGDLNEPCGVVVDKNGDVFVPNYYGPCQKFTGKGELLFAFAHPDPPQGPVAITSATGDQWGNVFLALRDTAGLVQNSVDPEPKPVRMLKFNNNGDLVASFPLWDDERGENSAAVDDHDRLYVLFKRADKTGVAIFEPR
jgi:uroporphyrinogen decarboxylase